MIYDSEITKQLSTIKNLKSQYNETEPYSTKITDFRRTNFKTNFRTNRSFLPNFLANKNIFATSVFRNKDAASVTGFLLKNFRLASLKSYFKIF